MYVLWPRNWVYAVTMSIVSFLSSSLERSKFIHIFKNLDMAGKYQQTFSGKEPNRVTINALWAHAQRKDLWQCHSLSTKKKFLLQCLFAAFLKDDCVQSCRHYIMRKLLQFSLVLTYFH